MCFFFALLSTFLRVLISLFFLCLLAFTLRSAFYLIKHPWRLVSFSIVYDLIYCTFILEQ